MLASRAKPTLFAAESPTVHGTTAFASNCAKSGSLAGVDLR